MLCTVCHVPVAGISSGVPTHEVKVTCFDCLDKERARSSDDSHTEALVALSATTAKERGVWRAQMHESTSDVLVALDDRPVAVGDVLTCEVRCRYPYLGWTDQYRIREIEPTAKTALAVRQPGTSETDDSASHEDPLHSSNFRYFDPAALPPDYWPRTDDSQIGDWLHSHLLEDDPDHQKLEAALAEQDDFGWGWQTYCPKDPEFSAAILKHFATGKLENAVIDIVGFELFVFRGRRWRRSAGMPRKLPRTAPHNRCEGIRVRSDPCAGVAPLCGSPLSGSGCGWKCFGLTWESEWVPPRGR